MDKNVVREFIEWSGKQQAFKDRFEKIVQSVEYGALDSQSRINGLILAALRMVDQDFPNGNVDSGVLRATSRYYLRLLNDIVAETWS